MSQTNIIICSRNKALYVLIVGVYILGIGMTYFQLRRQHVRISSFKNIFRTGQTFSGYLYRLKILNLINIPKQRVFQVSEYIYL